MDIKTFKAEVERTLAESPVDITLISKWFDAALESLKALHGQKSGIRHPRHRGDAREEDLEHAIRPIFQRAIELRKGFVINNITAHSREQDILLLDSATTFALIHTERC